MESIKLGIVRAAHYHLADDWGQLGRGAVLGHGGQLLPPLEPPILSVAGPGRFWVRYAQ